METPASPSPDSPSPKWGMPTKLVVGFTTVAIVAAMVVYFRNIIGPLLLAFILASLLQPISAWLSRVTHLPRRTAVNILYLVLLVALGAIITLAGFAIVQQAQSLIDFIQSFVAGLPEMIQQATSQKYAFGPFVFDLARLDLETVTRQLVGFIETLIGQAGSMLGRLATGAASFAWWGFFVILISYFLLTESSRLQQELVHIEIPGYNADIQRLARQFNRIWGAFFRGQLLIALLIVGAYYLLLTILGTRLALAIALLAGLAAFIPYVGPVIAWTVAGIVAFLQPENYFGLAPVYYAVLVIGCCLALNQFFDNLVYPRIMGSTLGVHPAAVLVAAIVATDLIGLVGLVLAAPVLATLLLFGRYVGRKMFDLDPWPAIERTLQPAPAATPRLWLRLQAAWRKTRFRRVK